MVFISIILSFYSASHRWTRDFGQSFIGEALRPFQLSSHWIVESVGAVWGGYVDFRGAYVENSRLRGELLELNSENSKLRAQTAELSQLKTLLGDRHPTELYGVVARVIGWDGNIGVRAITIDRGATNGIASGDAVVVGRSVVGQVVAVGPLTSKVLLLVDRVSGIDALLETSRLRGVVQGNGDNRCSMEFVLNTPGLSIPAGEKVFTSGMDGVFPKGLLVGEIEVAAPESSDLFKALVVKPALTLSTLETVLVLHPMPLAEDP